MKKKEKIKSKFWTLKYKNVIFYKTKVQTNQVQNKESTFYVLIVILLNLEIIYMWCQIFQHFFDRKENQKYLYYFSEALFSFATEFFGNSQKQGFIFQNHGFLWVYFIFWWWATSPYYLWTSFTDVFLWRVFDGLKGFLWLLALVLFYVCIILCQLLTLMHCRVENLYTNVCIWNCIRNNAMQAYTYVAIFIISGKLFFINNKVFLVRKVDEGASKIEWYNAKILIL